MYLFAAMLVLGSLGSRSSGAQHGWSYDDQAEWPELCVQGKRQSPVNIDSARAVQDARGDRIRAPLAFTHYSAVRLRGLNNGHTVKFSVDGDEEALPRLSGGPLRLEYVLDQLHFHWIGEHAIDHIKYPLEVHFVHHRRDMKLNEAKKKKDGIVVLAVLYKLSTRESDDTALQHLVNLVPELVNASSETPAETVDLIRVLSPDRDSYYTYEGSLTTPDCDEVVTWIVLDTPTRMTDQQYKTFGTVHVGGVANFRRLQPLQGRVVYRTPLQSSSAVTARPPALVSGVATAVAGVWAVYSGTATAVAELVKITIDAIHKIKKHFGVDFRI